MARLRRRSVLVLVAGVCPLVLSRSIRQVSTVGTLGAESAVLRREKIREKPTRLLRKNERFPVSVPRRFEILILFLKKRGWLRENDIGYTTLTLSADWLPLNFGRLITLSKLRPLTMLG